MQSIRNNYKQIVVKTFDGLYLRNQAGRSLIVKSLMIIVRQCCRRVKEIIFYFLFLARKINI